MSLPKFEIGMAEYGHCVKRPVRTPDDITQSMKDEMDAALTLHYEGVKTRLAEQGIELSDVELCEGPPELNLRHGYYLRGWYALAPRSGAPEVPSMSDVSDVEAVLLP